MKSPLRILHLEDDPRDAELVQETLAAEGILSELVRVESEADFVASLELNAFDLIFADYTLPSFDGISALKIARRSSPQVPFIFVSGTLGEEVAIEALKVGATDYVFKTRLARIAPSVQRALRESHERLWLSRAEQALRRSQAYLAEAQKLSHTGSFGWDVASGDLYWSEETYRIFDVDPTLKVTLAQVEERTHPEDKEELRRLVERVSRQRNDWDFEHRLLLPDGTVKHVRVVGRASTNESGRSEYVGAITDITELRRGEAETRKLVSLVENGTDFIGMASLEGEVLFVNAAGQALIGLSGDEQVRRTKIREYIAGSDLERFQKEALATVFRESRWEGETVFKHFRTGASIPVWQHIFFITEEGSGRRLALATICRDLTERKRAEALLRESELRFRAIFNEAGTGIAVVDVASGGPIENNLALQTMLGCTRDELSRLETYDALTFEPDRKADAIRFRELSEGGCEGFRQEKHLVLKDGRSVWANVIFTLLRDDAGRPKYIIAIHEDITDRKRQQAELQGAFDEIKNLRDLLYKETIALREEVDKTSMFEEIVGASPALQTVLARVSKVAPTDSTVLLTGETGTGKELFARAIHKRSGRASRAFVSVNCAATPQTLISSELFGHEKGAFTGALQRRLGRFELAEGGTLFLDEVGELPMETQIALLRVLQEREFDRVGGSQPIRADVRVIVATNRDLRGAMSSGAFRSDLFYRLNVFPIDIPPLRERKEDIPTLIVYFVDRYSRKIGKKIRSIDRKTSEMLQSYAWPGNIRELQNVIERSVIVCETEVFSVDPSWLSLEPSEEMAAREPLTRMSPAQEREAIERVLASTEGRVSGELGAAAQLGVPASTLESKIRALKINKYRFKRA
jgi:PAS domain S-box-containing protein